MIWKDWFKAFNRKALHVIEECIFIKINASNVLIILFFSREKHTSLSCCTVTKRKSLLKAATLPMWNEFGIKFPEFSSVNFPEFSSVKVYNSYENAGHQCISISSTYQ